MLDGEQLEVVLEHTSPGVAEPQNLGRMDLFALAHKGPDDRIQARTVTTRCQYSNTHGNNPTMHGVPARSTRPGTRAGNDRG